MFGALWGSERAFGNYNHTGLEESDWSAIKSLLTSSIVAGYFDTALLVYNLINKSKFPDQVI
ncbi:hypothetical protein MASR2M66_20350 [Chloroflexota bacterium]